MKKKAVGFLILLVAVTTCALLLASCDTTPTLQGITVTYDNAPDADPGNLGDFVYGSTLDEIMPSGLKVTAVYSDGSSKELAATDYTIKYYVITDKTDEITDVPDVLPVGSYEARVLYQSHQANFYFTVTQSQRDSALVLSAREWDYDEAPPEMSVTNFTPAEGYDDTVYYLAVAKADYDALSDEQKAEYWNFVDGDIIVADSPYSVSAGEYYVYASIPGSDDYFSTYTAISADTLVTINKAKLSYPNTTLVNHVGKFRYRGELGNVPLSSVVIEIIDLYDADALVDKTGEAIPGSYEFADVTATVDTSDTSAAVVFKIRDDLTDNYELADASPVQIPLEITPGTVDAPNYFSSDGYNSGFGVCQTNPNDYGIVKDDNSGYRLLFSHWSEAVTDAVLYTDGGNPVTVTVLEGEDDWGQHTYYVETPAEVGNYELRLVLKDTDNYVWSTSGSVPLSYKFDVLDKLTETKPSMSLYDATTLDDGSVVRYIGESDSSVVVIDGWAESSGMSLSYTQNGTQGTNYPVLTDIDSDGEQEYVVAVNGYGEFDFAISLMTSEYVWNDGTTAPVTFSFTTYPADIFDDYATFATVEVDNETGMPVDPQYNEIFLAAQEWMTNPPLDYTADFVITYATAAVGDEDNATQTDQFRGTAHNVHSSSAPSEFSTDAQFVYVVGDTATRYFATGTPHNGSVTVVDSDSVALQPLSPDMIYALNMTAVTVPATWFNSDSPQLSVGDDADGNHKIKITGTASDSSATTDTEIVIAFNANYECIGHKVTVTVVETANPDVAIIRSVQFAV